jgi:hypothetical protein
MSESVRRSAKDWREIVRAWRKSGLGTAEFAARRGLSPRTLAWWRWRLGQRGPAKVVSPELVRVEVAEESPLAGESASWELETAAGHTLRVYGGADGATVRLALGALLDGGAERSR